MAMTNHERVGKALELLKSGLGLFAEREIRSVYQDRAAVQVTRLMGEDRLLAGKPIEGYDAAALLKLMWEAWNDVFRRTLGPAERSLVQELREHRNRWAHQQVFSSDDADRALARPGLPETEVAAPGRQPGPGSPVPSPAPTPRRFHGSVILDATRVGRDAGRIADEVIAHLGGLVGSTVRVTLEIHAEVPAGVPDHVVRIVTENSRTLKFTSQGFEAE